MKKLVVTLSLVALATGAFAQGSITIVNSSSTTFHTNSLGIGAAAGNAQAASGGGNYFYEVLTAASTVAAPGSAVNLASLISGTWSDTGVSGVNSGVAGRTSGASITSANNWAASAVQDYLVVGWSATAGANWSQINSNLTKLVLTPGNGGNNYWTSLPGGLAPGSFLGWTVVGQVASNPSGQPGAGLFGASPLISGNTDLLVVGAVPEPATLALAGLGAAALMIFRRRK